MSKAKGSPTITVRIAIEDLQKLIALVDRTGYTLSEIVRMAISDMIKKAEKSGI